MACDRGGSRLEIEVGHFLRSAVVVRGEASSRWGGGVVRARGG